ncbi:MAG: hypothetical protein ACTHKF_04425 [Candidatus Nitrosocosmicus sp.]
MPTLSIFLIFLFALNVLNSNSSIFVYGHSLFGNNNNGSGIQVQTNGNYKVELSTNPSKILLNKSTDILLRVTSLLGGGSEIMELPVYLSLAKDGKLNNLQHTPVILSGGHYNFKSVFPSTGKYLLFVDIKDIYYTNTILNFIFELNVDVPFTDQFYDSLKSFFINYYYIYIPIMGLIIFLIIRSQKKSNLPGTGTMILAARWIYNKLHR